jgi:hypothetical protein
VVPASLCSLIRVFPVGVGELLIVRFSPIRADKLVEDAEDSYRDCERLGHPPVYSISTFGLRRLVAQQSVEDMLLQICREAPCGGRNVWLTTSELLGASGFEVALSEPPLHHYDVLLGNVLDRTDVDRLVAILEPGRRRNPAWKS